MIREATGHDLDGILEIYNEAIANTTAVYDYKVHTLEDRKRWLEKKQKDGYPVLVFEKNNQVAGFATFGPFRAWPAYKYTIEHSVYVNKELRQEGIATKLLQALIHIANRRQYATLVAGIDASNEKSIKLHEKLGFEYSGVIKRAGYKFGTWLDLAFYQLQLNGPSHPTEQ
ncbi:GNAT family N-acetyltransferase [Paenibacillus aurantiacus]|uniref:GNAT family N-acetyltransferase n=1 Tax=Paenibacillus aurantiacus TaxID=1936118 RepID=A0ABV5KUA4_9BACL